MSAFRVEVASERVFFGKLQRDFSIVTTDGREVARIFSGNGLEIHEAQTYAQTLAMAMSFDAEERSGRRSSPLNE